MPTQVDPDCERTVDDTFDKPTWKMSLNYKPEANTLVYGSIATGYRAGGFNTRGYYGWNAPASLIRKA